MWSYSRQRNRFASGKSDSRRKNTTGGSRMEWKPKAKVATDGSLGSASSSQRDNSQSFNSEPASDVNSPQESLLPLIKDLASGMENLNQMHASNDSKHLASVLTSDYSSKESLTLSCQSESSHMHPIREKTHSCPSKGRTGRGSEMYATPIKPSSVVCFPMEDRIPENGKQIVVKFEEKADNSGKPEDTDCASPIMRFDICPRSSVIKIKPPLHVINKEKRNQLKRSVEGQNFKILRPGMVLMKGYISCDEQIGIVKTCRELGLGDGGFYQPGYRDGSKVHLKMMCLGKNWDPQTSEYSDTRPIDNSKPPDIPDKFRDMVKKAIRDSNDHIQKSNSKADAGTIIPPISESIDQGLPVVSFSIGDSADFLFGNVGDIDEATRVILESGDVLIFGGKSRSIFHGVASIRPDTAPLSLLEATNMRPGRLNLTFRQF
ncbi:Oxoglutarate/iron-dependent dioxygenase [Cynara cardunculus var. scolymus]|uniref:Oxoglutarate/iron-dependent dioxygenase n=1 Tax=Cynara cardunculus var. scolymus TaxID=59895 RepID=A0A124SEE7_CYNCS|nr:Oxoglutarate/iron-dependent dioxygenase [Cynara cardunculus var. scolymus]